MLNEEQKTEIKREVFFRLAELLSSSDRRSKSTSDDVLTSDDQLMQNVISEIELELSPETADSLVSQLPTRDLGKPFAMTLTHHTRQGLTPASSETQSLERLVRVIARAVEVLGTSEKALRWINAPVRSLGDRTPVSLLDSLEGIANIEDALGRIEHGVW